jgi:hypothetical protein
MRAFALTYPQLCNQALALGLPAGELEQLARACELAERMADGLYRAQGVPFVCHLVRTASILLAEEQPIEVAMAGLLHSAYLLHLFDPARGAPRARERAELERVAGSEAHALVRAYACTPLDTRAALAAQLERLDACDERARRVLLLRLANELEDHLDGGLRYRAPEAGDASGCERGALLVELAVRLGRPTLAAELRQALADGREAAPPPALQRGRRRAYAGTGGRYARRPLWVRGWKALRRGALSRLGSPRTASVRAVRPLFDASEPLLELAHWERDGELLDAVRACVALQRRAADAELRERYRPEPCAAERVSPEALDALERAGRRPSDIVEDRALSNCIAFNFENVQGAVMDDAVVRARSAVDAIVARKLRALFRDGPALAIANSGHFWYPPGGYMGWHQNLRTPGWRLYVSFAEEPGRSFFRYRHPGSGEIVTALDGTWNFRLFEITPARPLWHAIHSQTHRFSIGYRVTPALSLAARLQRKLARWTRALGRR